VDGVTVDRYADGVEAKLAYLSQQLRTGAYQPQPIRRAHIPKPDGTTRPLGIPTVRDRVVQGAIRHAIEPIFEREFAQHSYGFRPGQGCKDSLRRAHELLKAGHWFVVDADLKGYFDTIPHDRLMTEVGKRVADGRVLKLIGSFLTANVMDGLERRTTAAGAPQGPFDCAHGEVLSPLLSNTYLNPLDHHMAGLGYEPLDFAQGEVRYADDFVILCQSRDDADRALAEVGRWTAQAGLSLHPDKTRIADVATDDFEFLGDQFHKGRRYARHQSVLKLRDAVRTRTRRTSGVSLAVTVARVNPVLKGWFVYFKQASGGMDGVDGRVRERLRGILRHQNKLPGRSGPTDVRRWPNRFFAGVGLFSLEVAHRLARLSMKMAH
jgi:RNA-directed DNA polymerase